MKAKEVSFYFPSGKVTWLAGISPCPFPASYVSLPERLQLDIFSLAPKNDGLKHQNDIKEETRDHECTPSHPTPIDWRPGQVHQLLALPILHGVTRGIVMYWNGIDHPELVPATAGWLPKPNFQFVFQCLESEMEFPLIFMVSK